MKSPAPAFLAFWSICISAAAQEPAALIPPKVNDPALKIELVATVPEVEACTTVCSDPAGAIYVGNDPRDGRLNTKEPVCTIVRFDGFASPDLIVLPDGSLAPPGPPRRVRTVFADGLYSPAGSAWHGDWLYVIHDPLMSRFKDTDGDGVADVREDLITNLGIEPNTGLNDHVVSGFTLGMDGFWYISVGDRGIYQAKSAKDGSTVTMEGGGIVRCRPDGSQLEIFSTGTRNHLQVNLDAEDNAFTRDNTDDGNGWWTRLTHHIEGGFYGYPHYRQAPNYGVTQPSEQTLSAIRQHGGTVLPAEEAAGAVPLNPRANFLPAMTDFGGGSPTGGFCYLSDGLPEQYRGKHFFSEWGKSGIFVTEVAQDGATFKFVSDTRLVESEKGGDFRPMQISVAADGSILIADWGYGGWKSPKVAGAVWRLYWPEAKPSQRLRDENSANLEELISALGHVDRDQRLRAQWALIGKGDAECRAIPTSGVVDLSSEAPVLARLSSLAQDESAPVIARCHALWALENIAGGVADATGHNTPQGKYPGLRGIRLVHSKIYGLLPMSYGARKFSGSSHAMIRRQAMRALAISRYAPELGVIYDAARAVVKDDDAVVRREAAKGLGRTSFLPVSALLRGMLDDSDRWVRYAAQRGLQKLTERHGLAAWDDPGLLKPVLSEHLWLTLEGLRLGEPYTADLRRFEDLWLQQLDIPDYIAGRVSGKYPAETRDRARAARLLGQWAYQPKPYDGKWWGTQPVKNPPPLRSIPWPATPQVLETLSAALSDDEAEVRLAAAGAFTQFILDVKPETESARRALDTLRSRLTAETDPQVRRQLIESLGVQKDPRAADAFMQIALDEQADAAFRDAAITALVNVGGDRAKQVIAQLASAQVSPAATRKIIEAAGELKVMEAAPALITRLKDENAGNREAAAKSLRQLGPKTNAAPALIEALGDSENKVQIAAIEALGSMRDPAALPSLLALAQKNRHKREAISAIANMPDASAIPVLVEALREKNTSIRRAAVKGLKEMRELALPRVEELLASGRVPEELVPEIRNAFYSGALVKWKMIGPFENVWEAVHPPETDALANHGAPDLSKKYLSAEGKDVAWREVTADAETGRVNLEQVFKTNAMVCAYAYASIETPEAAEAKLLVGSDDQIAVWLNGRKVHNVGTTRGFEADKDDVPVQLSAGVNHLLVKIGNAGGSWEFAARMPGHESGRFVKPNELPIEEKQRSYALAAGPGGAYLNLGDAAKGEKLFFDQTAAMGGICATCHAVGNRGGMAGPNLSAIGTNYKRPDLITSILEPGKTIALGFEQVLVETTGGDTIVGALRSEAGEVLTILTLAGQSQPVPKASVKTLTHVPTSLMPVGLTLGLTPAEFTDLLAYLESLRGS